MTLIQATNWIIYNGFRKPTNSINDKRWEAMAKHIRNRLLTEREALVDKLLKDSLGSCASKLPQ